MRIGKIKYLNCLPYYAGWESCERFQFEEGTPADMNRRMQAGELDAAPVSSAEYLERPGGYFLIPGFGIASRGYVRSVTLFSKRKIEDLDGAKIGVTNQSLTSVRLLDILLAKRYGLSVQMTAVPSDPKAMLSAYDAALLIGDDALTAVPNKWIFRYDLGHLWQEWQNLPFVYALWVMRRGLNFSAGEFYQALRERFLYNSEHLSECIQKHFEIGEFDRRYAKIFGYLNGIQYQLDDACMNGLRKFAELGKERGWCRAAGCETEMFAAAPDCTAAAEEK